MSAPLEPPRLQELVDLAERPRRAGWSLRAALCRYAQPQPVRSGRLLTVIRRVDGALGQHTSDLRADGAVLLATLEAGGDSIEPSHARPLALLRLAADMDAVGDQIATWAVDRQPPRPDAAIDQLVDRVVTALAALGVQEEPTEPPRGMRSRG